MSTDQAATGRHAEGQRVSTGDDAASAAPTARDLCTAGSYDDGSLTCDLMAESGADHDTVIVALEKAGVRLRGPSHAVVNHPPRRSPQRHR